MFLTKHQMFQSTVLLWLLFTQSVVLWEGLSWVRHHAVQKMQILVKAIALTKIAASVFFQVAAMQPQCCVYRKGGEGCSEKAVDIHRKSWKTLSCATSGNLEGVFDRNGLCQRFQNIRASFSRLLLPAQEKVASFRAGRRVPDHCFLLHLLRADRKGKCCCSSLCAPFFKSPTGQLSVAEIGVRKKNKNRYFCAIREYFCFVTSIKHSHDQFPAPAGSGRCANELSSTCRLHLGMIWQDWYFIPHRKRMSIPS